MCVFTFDLMVGSPVSSSRCDRVTRVLADMCFYSLNWVKLPPNPLKPFSPRIVNNLLSTFSLCQSFLDQQGGGRTDLFVGGDIFKCKHDRGGCQKKTGMVEIFRENRSSLSPVEPIKSKRVKPNKIQRFVMCTFLENKSTGCCLAIIWTPLLLWWTLHNPSANTKGAILQGASLW